MIVLLITAASCCKQKESIIAIPAITEADGIRIVQEFNDAIMNPTVQLLENLCAEELTYGHSSGLIQNKATFIDDLVNGPYDFKSVKSPELSVEVSENTVIARFIFLATAIKDEKPIEIRLGCIQVFQQNKNGQLKLLARQAYKLPTTN
jgi:hypothetical protein